MSFHEVQFPTDISYGSAGGPGFSTFVIVTDSGAEERVARWGTARHQFDVSYGIKDRGQLATLLTFYMARQGAASGFRYKDWTDFTTAADHFSAHAFGDQQIGTGDGSTTVFQLAKKYTSGGVTRTRNLTKPVSGTVLVGKNGVDQATGWTVNTTNGKVTFTVAPVDGDTITAGCEFDVPVRFGEEADKLLSLRLDSFDTGSIPSIPIVEVIDAAEIQDEFFYGGAFAHGSISANVSITPGQGRVQTFNPTVAGLDVILPAVGSLPLGGPHFFLVNLSANSMDVVTDLGTNIFTLAALSSVELWLGLDSSQNRVWKAK